jgi:hypothetical protein
MSKILFVKDELVSDFDLSLFHVESEGVNMGAVTASYEKVFFEMWGGLSSAVLSEVAVFMRQQEVKFFHIE